MATKLMQAAGAQVKVWDLLPELIGTEAAQRMHRASLQPYLVSRRKRREVTA